MSEIQFTLSENHNISLPYTLEGDRYGRTFISFEDGNYFVNYQCYSPKTLDKREITRQEATEYLKGIVQTPYSERFPRESQR